MDCELSFGTSDNVTEVFGAAIPTLRASEVKACSVCYQPADSDNSVYSCRQCGVATHAECYGWPLTTMVEQSGSENNGKIDDQESARKALDAWTCSVCQHNVVEPICVLCPKTEGAMKLTTTAEWVHLSCANWCPEAFYREVQGCEPIDTLQIPAAKFNKTCYFCQISRGACVSCSDDGCRKHFHVTCGMERGVHMEFRQNGRAPAVIHTFCLLHSKKWQNKAKRSRLLNGAK